MIRRGPSKKFKSLAKEKPQRTWLFDYWKKVRVSEGPKSMWRTAGRICFGGEEGEERDGWHERREKQRERDVMDVPPSASGWTHVGGCLKETAFQGVDDLDTIANSQLDATAAVAGRSGRKDKRSGASLAARNRHTPRT